MLEGVVERGQNTIVALIATARQDGAPILLSLRTATPTMQLAQEQVPEVLRIADVSSASAADFDTLFGGGAQ